MVRIGLVFCLMLAGCVDQTPDDPPPPTPAVPADWCLSTAPDGTALVLTDGPIIPAGELAPAQRAAIPDCAAFAPPLPL